MDHSVCNSRKRFTKAKASFFYYQRRMLEMTANRSNIKHSHASADGIVNTYIFVPSCLLAQNILSSVLFLAAYADLQSTTTQ